MKIVKHMLTGDQITQLPSPNVSGKFAKGQPDTIVIHFTAGRSATSSANWLCNPEAKASAHIVLGPKGEIYQLAPFDVITWHAGESAWQERSGFNKYSIGIEIDNPGRLEKRQSGFFTWFGENVTNEMVTEGIHRNETAATYWHSYTSEQIEKTEELCALLIKQYGIKFILGHEEFAPGRKQDPGPAFPLDKIRNRLLYNDRKTEESIAATPATPEVSGYVNVNLLNIRNQPSSTAPMAAEPLKQGTQVKVLEEKDGWLRVKVETEGWVSKDYIKKAIG